MKILIFLLVSLLISCSSGSKKNHEDFKPEWEKKELGVFCSGYGGRHTTIMKCQYKPKDTGQKLFDNAKAGRVYYGYRWMHTATNLMPKYEKVYFLKGYVLVKEYDEDTFQIYNPTTQNFHKTNIGHVVVSNRHHFGSFRNWNTFSLIGTLDVHEMYSPDRKSILKYDSNGKLIYEIKNVDGDISKNYIPSVNGGRVVRHNVDGEKYWQMYDDNGVKLGPAVDMKKSFAVQHFTAKKKIEWFIYENLGDYNFRPLFSNGTTYLDAWNNDMGFVGVQFSKGKNKTYYIRHLVFKDGNRYLYSIKKQRSFNYEPFYKNKNQHSDLLAEVRKVFEEKSDFFVKEEYRKIKVAERGKIESHDHRAREKPNGKWTLKNIKRFPSKELTFNSKKELETYINDLESGLDQKLAEQKIQLKKEAEEERKRQASLEWSRRNNERMMKKEAQIRERARQAELRNKNRRRFSDIDLTKGFNTEGAKERAECHAKNAKNLNTAVTRGQGYYLKGNCK